MSCFLLASVELVNILTQRSVSSTDNRQRVRQRNGSVGWQRWAFPYLRVDALDIQNGEKRFVRVEPSRYHCLQGARAKSHMEPSGHSVEKAAQNARKGQTSPD